MYKVVIEFASENDARDIFNLIKYGQSHGIESLKNTKVELQETLQEKANKSLVEAVPSQSIKGFTDNITKESVISYFRHYSCSDFIVTVNTKEQLLKMFFACYNMQPLSKATKLDIVGRI